MPDKSNIIKKLVVFVSSLLAAVWTTLIAALFFTAQDKSPFYILIPAAVVADLALILFYAYKINGKPELKVRAFTSLAGAFSCAIGAYLIMLSAPAYFTMTMRTNLEHTLYMASNASLQQSLYMTFGLVLAAAGVIIFLWGIIASGKRKILIHGAFLLLTAVIISATTVFGFRACVASNTIKNEIKVAQEYFDLKKYDGVVTMLLSGNTDTKSKNLLHEALYRTALSLEGYNIVSAKEFYLKIPAEYKDVIERLDKINKYEKYFGRWMLKQEFPMSGSTNVYVKDDVYRITISAFQADVNDFAINENMIYESSFSAPGHSYNVKVSFKEDKMYIEYSGGIYQTPKTDVYEKMPEG